MMLCLVTDRRRLGTALRLEAHEWIDAVRAQVFAAAAAGILVIRPAALTSIPKNSESVALLQAMRVLVSRPSVFSEPAFPCHSPNFSIHGLLIS